MSLVRYAVYIDSLARFSHLGTQHFVYLEEGSIYVQTDRIRTPTTVVEHLELNGSVMVIGKSPLLGFKWTLPSGVIRKFQLTFVKETAYKWLASGIEQHVPIVSASASTSDHVNRQNHPGPSGGRDQAHIGHTWEAQAAAKNDNVANVEQQAPGTQKTASKNNQSFVATSSATQFPEPFSSTSAHPGASAQPLCSSTVVSRIHSIPLKMPTPVTRAACPAPSNHDPTSKSPTDTSTPRMLGETISHEELGTLFAAFIRDKRNIKLCEAVEQFWAKSGMP